MPNYVLFTHWVSNGLSDFLAVGLDSLLYIIKTINIVQSMKWSTKRALLMNPDEL
jgi:hypothetical protein